MLREINVEWSACKSYKTLENLNKKIDEEKAKWPEHDDRFIIIKTPDDRWTAVVILDKNTGGYVGRYDFLKI